MVHEAELQFDSSTMRKPCLLLQLTTDYKWSQIIFFFFFGGGGDHDKGSYTYCMVNCLLVLYILLIYRKYPMNFQTHHVYR